MFKIFISIKDVIRNSELWDDDFYNMHNEDVAKSKIDPLEHYIKYGWKEGRNPSLNFNTSNYLILNQDCKDGDLCPLVHYCKNCKKRLILRSFTERPIFTDHHMVKILKKTKLFDPLWYLSTYADVAMSGIDPYMHYIKYGWKEGRKVSKFFDTEFYKKEYMDVSLYDFPAIVHYEMFGKFQSRKYCLFQKVCNIIHKTEFYFIKLEVIEEKNKKK